MCATVLTRQLSGQTPGFLDLWHFFILFFLIQFGFIFLAMAQFADTKHEFETLRSSFEAMWDMFLGRCCSSAGKPAELRLS